MGGLHALAATLLLTLAVGCEESGEQSATAAPPARVQAVTKKAGVSEKDLDGFCDIRDQGSFSLPEISGGKQPQGARWVNLWATWCKSCVKEMPMIEQWKSDHELQVLYVSTDEEAEMLAQYLKDHPETPKTAKMVDPDALEDWMKKLGLDDGAGLPLHVFVGADDSVRCARAAAVSEHHLAMVKHLLR